MGLDYGSVVLPNETGPNANTTAAYLAESVYCLVSGSVYTTNELGRSLDERRDSAAS